MEFLCPECLGPLESSDGREARCTMHGGRFEILFARQAFSAPPGNPPPQTFAPVDGARCSRHPNVPASHACANCGTPICGVCSFEQPAGHLCPDCAVRATNSTAPAAIAPKPPEGAHCVQHPRLPATAQCQSCGGFMCNTCKFELPGGVQICPVCATTPRTTLDSKQKLKLAGAYATAVWCTVVYAALFSGFFRRMATSPGESAALGWLLILILLAPAITGVSLAVGAMRRHSSPISLWIAVIWNSAILGGFLLLMIIGLLKK